MKLLFFLISFLAFAVYGTKAQSPNRTQNANIFDIKDTNGTVIARMSLIPGLRNGICLKDYQQKDSSGLFITEYSFIRPGHLVTNNAILVLQFDKAFEDVRYEIQGEATDITVTKGATKTGISFAVATLDKDSVIRLIIISKTSILPTITGISGQITNLDSK